MGTALNAHGRYWNGIAVFGDYLPWGVHKANGGDSSSYPAYSGRILDLKGKNKAAVAHFAGMIEPELRGGIVIVTVPSHDPAKGSGGLGLLAAALADRQGRVNGAECLVRKEKIVKLAHGGDRDKSVHLKSVIVARPSLIRGRDVLLVDDVAKTGNSLEACRELLLKAGARTVECAVIGKT